MEVHSCCCTGGAFRNGGWQRWLSLIRYPSSCPWALSGGWRGPGVWQQQLRHPGISPHREHSPCSTLGHGHTQVRPYFRILGSYISRALTVQLWWNSSGEQHPWSSEIIYLHAQDKKSQWSLFTFLTLIFPSQTLNFSISVFIVLLWYSEKFQLTQAGNAK